MIFSIQARALKLEERQHHVETTKDPATGKAIETTTNAGWFLTIDLGGVGFSFALGPDKPTFPLYLNINVREAPK